MARKRLLKAKSTECKAATTRHSAPSITAGGSPQDHFPREAEEIESKTECTDFPHEAPEPQSVYRQVTVEAEAA